MIPFLAIALLQQGIYQGASSPPSGDTIGYWQQRVHYTITATLDEPQTALHARATLVYVNNSPDTLREMFFHQYLNAFRPGSKWSASDEHENRVRFQNLREPDYGYERLTSAPVVNGAPVVVDYPGAPDSTIMHFRLPAGLAPGDSLRITFAWDARPSTVPRRQGRRGRTYDFAQWYPKVAVYDRGGWQQNPLIPAGELYGEYGTYDVTVVVRDDQVLASTGVPVVGDPGWARVSRNGAPRLANEAYANLPTAPAVTVPLAHRAVRFYAENVHHFAWSASPDYRYEGGIYVRQVSPTRFQTWDTVSVHVLFKPGDDTTWGGGRAVERTITAARWLESIWGPYAYPQISNVHRIDGGGTEFPMMIMDGSASQGLILHEFGHVFTYGILGNNEWRSGWLDEGLTDYQTDWAQRLTPQEQIGRAQAPPRLAEGYRLNGITIPRSDSLNLPLWREDLLGRAEPIGTAAYDFREFGIYNEMIYDRAKLMYSQLRDVMGDSVFLSFFHDYYNRWALKHVDERAMRASAERAYGRSLAWFFDQWVRGTGVMDYAIGSVRITQTGSRFETTARVERTGELRHPMPVGVQTASGWTLGRADQLDVSEVRIVTNERPTRVELDPYHVTWDWDWRNNFQSGSILGIREPRFAFNWPYLDQADRSHSVVALTPAAWYSNPQGGVVGLRAKSSYLSLVDKFDAGLAFGSRSPQTASGTPPNFVTRFNVWVRGENVTLPGLERPLMNYSGGVNFLDGILKIDAARDWDLSPFVFAAGPTIAARAYATAAIPSSGLLLPEQWQKSNVGELGGSGMYRTTVSADGSYEIARAAVGVGYSSATDDRSGRGYIRGEAAIGAVRSIVGPFSQLRVRIFGGFAEGAPTQRAIFASSQDPFQTFNNDLFRPRGAVFKQDGVNYLPLGGAALRGFDVNIPLDAVVSGNGELLQRLFSGSGRWGRGSVSLSLFGDAGFASSKLIELPDAFMADFGAGLVVEGRLYDRDLSVRLDAPVFVNHSGLAGWRGLGSNGSFAARWVLTVGDLW